MFKKKLLQRRNYTDDNNGYTTKKIHKRRSL